MAQTERLINSTAELKSVFGAVQADLDFGSIQSHIDMAELSFVIPAFGVDTFDILRNDNLTGVQKSAKKFFQQAVANFFMYSYAAFGAVQISEQGIFVFKNDSSLPASDKKIYLLRKQSKSDAFKALEAGINYLESNAAYFAAYIASDNHKNNRRFYCNTTDAFSSGFDLRGNAEVFASLKTVMGSVEEGYIDPLLGEELSGALRSAILSGTTSATQKALLDKIVKAVAPLTIAEAIPYSIIKFENGEIVSNSLQGNTENVEASAPADQRRLQATMNDLLQKGQQRIGALTKWLNANASDFPGYQIQNLNARNDINADGGSTYFL